MSDSEQMVVERSSSAREELLIRVKFRDNWLKIQLYVSAILWALAKGIKLGIAEPISPFPEALVLAPPIALILSSLYYVEDGLIHRLSKYVKSIDSKSWDSSTQLKNYAKGLNLILRLIAQLAAFVALPLYLILLQPPNECYKIVVQVFFLILTITIIILGYLQRRNTGSDND